MTSEPDFTAITKFLSDKLASEVVRVQMEHDQAMAVIKSIKELDPVVRDMVIFVLKQSSSQGSDADAREKPLLSRATKAAVKVLDKLDFSYGAIAAKIRSEVNKIAEDEIFTSSDVIRLCGAVGLNAATVTVVLNRMVNMGRLTCVQKGVGKSPSQFQRISMKNNNVVNE